MRHPQYDPAIKQTDIGQQVYTKWLRIHRHDCCPEFKEYPSFYEWAIASGFTGTETLLRINRSLPYGPQNCYWKDARGETAAGREHEECIERWNRTVNKIRKAHGMEPLEIAEKGERRNGE